ncbi:MAG: HipA family kinase, partial [Cystobacter sp.]
MKTLTATRYVTPLREGGSCPAIVEAEDSGMYVLKFRGAGQGIKALVAEIISGELARAFGLRVPELVFLELDAALGRAEPDGEIRDLIKASAGLNLGMDYLPGSITFDPTVSHPTPSPAEASALVCLDAYVTNVDRTPKNPNLLCWHSALWLIDHGASLYFHHSWDDYLERSQSRFPAVKDHVL